MNRRTKKVLEGKFYENLYVNATPEETKQFNEIKKKVEQNIKGNKEPYYNISRKQSAFFMKFSTPVSSLEELFLKEQKSRGNSTKTIEYYERCFKKLHKFLCWNGEQTGYYETLTQEQIIKRGKGTPYVVLEQDNILGDYREFLMEVEGVSEQTVISYFRGYKAFVMWCVENELIDKQTLKFKIVEPDLKEVYTDAEIEKLQKRPNKDDDFTEYRNWVMVNFFLGTGARISTVINVKISDVDFESNLIYLNRQKGGKKNAIPIHSELKPILREYINSKLCDENGEYNSEYLFPSSYIEDTKPLTRQGAYHAIASYNLSRGVKKTSVHLFRHTFAKRWILGGGDVISLQRALGHSTITMAAHYANIYGADIAPKLEAYAPLSSKKIKGGRRRR